MEPSSPTPALPVNRYEFRGGSEPSNKGEKPISSEDKKTDRLYFNASSLEEGTEQRTHGVAIKGFLLRNSPTPPKMGFFERFRFASLKVKTATGQEVFLKVNLANLRKQFNLSKTEWQGIKERAYKGAEITDLMHNFVRRERHYDISNEPALKLITAQSTGEELPETDNKVQTNYEKQVEGDIGRLGTLSVRTKDGKLVTYKEEDKPLPTSINKIRLGLSKHLNERFEGQETLTMEDIETLSRLYNQGFTQDVAVIVTKEQMQIDLQNPDAAEAYRKELKKVEEYAADLANSGRQADPSALVVSTASSTGGAQHVSFQIDKEKKSIVFESKIAFRLNSRFAWKNTPDSAVLGTKLTKTVITIPISVVKELTKARMNGTQLEKGVKKKIAVSMETSITFPPDTPAEDIKKALKEF